MKQQAFTLLLPLCTILITTAAEKCDRPVETALLCRHLVTAKDLSGLDGCDILLEEADSTLLLATNLEEFAPELQDGESAMVGYEKQEDMVSICMAEKSIVTLTCFQKLPGMADCTQLVDPYRLEWSEKAMQEMDARKVELIYIGTVPAYRFTSSNASRIYACNGLLMCNSKAESDCSTLTKHVKEARVIYIVNE